MFRDRPRRAGARRASVRRPRRATEESDFQKQLKVMAEVLGWLYYHTNNSIGSEPGYLDTTMVQGHRLIFAELKKQGGKLTKEQKIWIAALSKVTSVEVYLWEPSDAEEIIRILQST